MRRMICLICMMVFLVGCNKASNAMDLALQLRQELNGAEGCKFDVRITADYGTSCYTFLINCQWGKDGSIDFTVTAPDSISGITGSLTDEGAKLTFDDVALAFPMLADGQLSPISAPWIMMRALRSGFISSAGHVDGKVRLIVDDIYQEDPLSVHIWLDGANVPMLAEIYHNGYRILTMELENFQIL